MRPKWLLQRDALPVAVELLDQADDAIGFPTATVPDYLTAHYWWAYIHPKAVKVFERQWLVNFILWGNYARLRDAALAELGEVLPGSTLQVACLRVQDEIEEVRPGIGHEFAGRQVRHGC